MSRIRNTLAEYKHPHQPYYLAEEDGIAHVTATELLHSGILGFCGCGYPEENLRYVLGGLTLIEERGPAAQSEWAAWYADHKARELAHHGSEAAARFFHYWCADPDTKERPALTEHGGCIPGWLTGDGAMLLALLREWAALPEAQE